MVVLMSPRGKFYPPDLFGMLTRLLEVARLREPLSPGLSRAHYTVHSLSKEGHADQPATRSAGVGGGAAVAS